MSEVQPESPFLGTYARLLGLMCPAHNDLGIAMGGASPSIPSSSFIYDDRKRRIGLYYKTLLALSKKEKQLGVFELQFRQLLAKLNRGLRETQRPVELQSQPVEQQLTQLRQEAQNLFDKLERKHATYCTLLSQKATTIQQHIQQEALQLIKVAETTYSIKFTEDQKIAFQKEAMEQDTLLMQKQAQSIYVQDKTGALRPLLKEGHAISETEHLIYLLLPTLANPVQPLAEQYVKELFKVLKPEVEAGYKERQKLVADFNKQIEAYRGELHTLPDALSEEALEQAAKALNTFTQSIQKLLGEGVAEKQFGQDAMPIARAMNR